MLATTEVKLLRITPREKEQCYANFVGLRLHSRAAQAGDPVTFGCCNILVMSMKRQYMLLADEDLIVLTDGGDTQDIAALYDRHSRVAY